MKYFVAVVIVLTLLCGCASYRGVDEIKSGGTLVVATNAYFPPYEYYEGENIVGFDIDIMKEVANELEVELEIKDMAFESLLNTVKIGGADVAAAGLSITAEREKVVAFTDKYAHSVQVIISHNGSPVQSKADIKGGVKVGVQAMTTAESYLSDSDGVIVMRYAKGEDAVRDLAAGKVDCVIFDDIPAKMLVQKHKELIILPDLFEDEYYAFAVNKENTELISEINKAIAKIRADGRYEKIYSSYFRD